MTEKEMKERIKEIDKQRDALRFEKEKYEKYFSDKRRGEELNNNKSYIGKCFKTKGLKDNKTDNVKAFKILDVLDSPNEKYALCLVLLDGCRSTCFKEQGIQKMTLSLWVYNDLRMMNKATDAKMIDYYKEIPEDEFKIMYSEYSKSLLEHLN